MTAPNIRDVGPYRIVRKIATGGMAEIFLARQRGLEGVERTVVLKRILPEYSNDEEFVTMFLDEARLMAALSHPNIAQAFDLGRADDSYYLVMEYVRGPTLGDLLRATAKRGEPGLPEREAMGITLAIAEALAYVHDRHDEFGRPLNIVHRDLNPANVIVSYDGAVKLIDFGIAKAASKVHQTRTEVVKGTYGYIAPEQLTHSKSIDHRADVYALGVLLYEMCIGYHPFEATGVVNVVQRMLKGSYKRPKDVVDGFPAALDRLISRCLAVRPQDRPQGVRPLIRELAAYMASRGLVSTMSEIALLSHGLVPDTEGPAPLRPLQSSINHPAIEASDSTTRKLNQPEIRKRSRSLQGANMVEEPTAPLIPLSAGEDEEGDTESFWESFEEVDSEGEPTRAEGQATVRPGLRHRARASLRPGPWQGAWRSKRLRLLLLALLCLVAVVAAELIRGMLEENRAASSARRTKAKPTREVRSLTPPNTAQTPSSDAGSRALDDSQKADGGIEGAIAITSTPPGAEVKHHGVSFGTTPLSLPAEEAAKHGKVRLFLEGYKVKVLPLTPGETSFDVVLEANTNTVAAEEPNRRRRKAGKRRRRRLR